MDATAIGVAQLRSAGVAVADSFDAATAASPELFAMAAGVVAFAVPDSPCPAQLPGSVRDRFGACQRVAEALAQHGGKPVDYSALMYPEPAKTKALVAVLAEVVAKHSAAKPRPAAVVEVISQRTDMASRAKAALQLLAPGLGAKAKRGKKEAPPTAPLFPQPPVSEAAFRTAAADCPKIAPCLVFGSRLERAAADLAARGGLDPGTNLGVPATGVLADNRCLAAPRVAVMAARTSTTAALFGAIRDVDGAAAEASLALAVEAEAAAQREAEVSSLSTAVEQQQQERQLQEERLNAAYAAAKRRLSTLRSQVTAAKARSREAQREAQGEVSTAASELRAELAAVQARLELARASSDPEAMQRLRGALEEIEGERAAAEEAFLAKRSKLQKRQAALQQQLGELGETPAEAAARRKADVKKQRRAARAKAAEVEELRATLERCPQNDRGRYAAAVADMSSSLRKQQEEIDKIGADTAKVELLVAECREEVGGTFEEFQTTLVSAAKQDDFTRKAFAKVVALHDAYKKLIEALEARGAVRKEQHDAESRKEKLERALAGSNTAQLEIDLASLKAELASGGL